MTIPRETSRRFDAVLERLEREQVVVLELDSLERLLVETDDPLAASTRTGIDDAAATLAASRSMPEQVTVRVVLPAGSASRADVAGMTTAFHRRATDQALATWRDAMAVRSMGRRQFPVGVVIAAVSAVLASAVAAWAASLDNDVTRGVLFVVSGMSITVAWVVSWMVVETSFFDWRQTGRMSAAYELLSRAALEVTDGAG